MFYMYETIIITKILLQFLKPKTHRVIKGIMFYYFPSPGKNAIYVLCKQQYVLCRKYRQAYESINMHP